MMARGVESLFLMNMISLELCRLPTQIHQTNVTPGARFLSPNPSALVESELLPRRLLAKLGLPAGRIGRGQDDAHGGPLLLRPQVLRGTELVHGGALVRRAGRLRLRLRRRLVRGDRGGEHQGRNERSIFIDGSQTPARRSDLMLAQAD